MARVEVGKGLGRFDTINIFNAPKCHPQCPFHNSDNVVCHKYNGNRVLVFLHGVTRESLEQVKEIALCTL